jgi:hypothetical protein
MTVQQRVIDVSDSMAVADVAKREAEATLAMAEMFKVECAEDFNAANVELIAVKKKMREYETQRKDMKEPILEAGRKVDAFFKPAIEVLAKVEGIIKGQMIAYQREQERIRREAEDLARKELERAERARMKAIEKGDVTKVAKLEEKVANIAATVAEAPQVAKVKGFSITEIWSAQVVDVSKIPREYMVPDQARLDELAKAHKENLSIPGVLAVKRDSAASRAR